MYCHVIDAWFLMTLPSGSTYLVNLRRNNVLIKIEKKEMGFGGGRGGRGGGGRGRGGRVKHGGRGRGSGKTQEWDWAATLQNRNR